MGFVVAFFGLALAGMRGEALPMLLIVGDTWAGTEHFS